QYSLALTFCELGFGRTPFTGSITEQIEQRRQGRGDFRFLPEALRPAVARALSPNPRSRFPSCWAFYKALATPLLRDSPDLVSEYTSNDEEVISLVLQLRNADPREVKRILLDWFGEDRTKYRRLFATEEVRPYDFKVIVFRKLMETATEELGELILQVYF